MRISIAQQNYIIGDIEYNKNKIIQHIQVAQEKGDDIILFSELAICGYPPKDLLFRDKFISKCRAAIDEITAYVNDALVIIGAPSINPHKDGKYLFNSAYCIHQRKIEFVAHKTLLPTYDVFNEYRYFEPAKEWNCIEFKGKKIAITICEDIWDVEEDPMYMIRPLDRLSKENPDFILNLSASPFSYLQQEKRHSVIAFNALKYKKPIIYCNTVGAHTDLIFDGASVVCNDKGEIISRLKSFEEDTLSIDVDSMITTAHDVSENETNLELQIVKKTTVILSENQLEFVYQGLLLGIRDYFRKMNFRQAVIASSGGLDSALTLALAVDALGKENVHALLMPSEFSSSHSVDDAVELSKNYGTTYDILPIKEMYSTIDNGLQSIFKDGVFNVTQENIQSRIRGMLVMAYSNKYGHILLNTSNKSELATGYGTLYGDMAGGLSVLGDVYKSQAYQLAHFINKNKNGKIPEHILTKAPSAELRPGQKDSDSLPVYSILDEILFHYIDNNKDAASIIASGYDKDTVEKAIRLVNINEYKRYQFCPIIRVSYKAFGPGRLIPLVRKIDLHD